MQFEFTKNTQDHVSADIAVVFAFQEKKGKITSFSLLSAGSLLDKKLKTITQTLEAESFKAGVGESVTMYTNNAIVPTKVVVLGLGEKITFTASDLRNVIGKLAMSIKSNTNSVSISIPSENEINLSVSNASQCIGEGFLLGSYEFAKYKTGDKPTKVLETVIIAEENTEITKQARLAIKKAEVYSQATNVARDLVNEPAIEMTPTALATLAKDIARKNDEITCKVFDKAQAEKMGMHAFLGIARASETPPKFIYLHYTPKKKTSKAKVALVGKGITFDTGGINLKPEQYMTTMKEDMSGAAAVLATFSVISEIKPTCEVMGLIAATPNMISGNAIVPGDVVRAMNGKTIEVLNTDAEGRVTLADSLSFAVKEKATVIIDLATLTGACMVALGTDIAGLFTNDQNLSKELQSAGHDAGEKMWELPLEKEYKELNKSDVADISNVGSSRYGGAITAALFLQEFIGNTSWAHIDIAGPAFPEKPTNIGPKGGSGFGVRTLLNYLQMNFTA